MRLTGTHRLQHRRKRQGTGVSPPSRTDATGSKRRIEEEEGGPAMKLFLSEDAVSARLQRLSLDNDHSYGANGFPRTSKELEPLFGEFGENGRLDETEEEEEEDNVVVDPGEFSMNHIKVLSVCPLLEETLQQHRPGSILPERILHSLSSPCMELVLWSPPSGHIQQLIRCLAGTLEPPLQDLSPNAVAKDQEDQMEL
ncbi:hypothetical protein XENTR_v10017410 [Xenopus tropicalis]|uniref:Uncharacterized protein LOC100489386 n=2 Tax=Xenopus tropicalis TaxID=8364 RepID=A0A8J1JSQ5_XENTR|nr:uncharacterized protein LOC100489386 [Xenopus tropicalis]XP_031760041.1 uncharacterized protein LOC100489386 [Xenopus tropicalis]XP_031760042.1 uncharacterized protein LOC100489386 [Xenopus tropicalis]XP_031760044.1 uncharacterized protein LOC100489386 [Xenopus tropicalis]XP_031760045.1 uncharacterized protein LOC100489386 [Xenopus tropicalis]KAE8599968.1 hypothetical protein XENTR_v10017410 [Xenopus tropicalis]|eukprot:XP_002942925.3 PREDICTED: uncharacterized protein LOC100489386 [Xenopus tropicalis]